MKRGLPVLVLLLVAAGWFFVAKDPLHLFGAVERREEGAHNEKTESLDPTLQGRSDGAKASEPQVLDGVPTGVLVLQLGKGSLSGVVTGDGLPLGGARVDVLLPSSASRAAVRTKADGTWEVKGLPTGRFDLVASADGWRSRAALAPELAEGGAQKVDPIDLRRVPPMTDGIEVRATDTFGRPVASARVLATTMYWALHTSMGPELAGVAGVVSKTAATDEKGTAVLQPLPADTYDVVVSAPGFLTTAQPKVVVSSGRVAHLVFRLAPGSAISGVLLDEAGKPLEGGYVTGLHQPSWASALTVRSGGDGTFTLDGLREGNYMLIAGHQEHGEVVANPVASPSAGNRITLGGVGKVALQVVTPEGKPVLAYRVRPYREQPFGYVYSMSYAVENPEGRTTLTLPPGVWHLGVQGADGSFDSDDTAKIVLGETAEARVVLAPTGVVRGVVTDADGHVVVGAEVYVRRGGFPTVASREQYARTDDDGRFEVKGLPLGRKAGLHVHHVRYADHLLDADPAPAGSAAEVTVRLEAGARILGHVTDAEGRPTASEQVNLMQGYNFYEAKSTVTDESGAYVFEAVPAGGKYSVSTGPLESNSRGVVKSNLEVPASGDLVVDLQAVSGGTRPLEGTVRRGGQPVAGATVSFLDARGYDHMVSTTTDASGRFRADGVLPGRVTVRVDAEDGASTTVTRNVPAEGAVDPVSIEFGTAGLAGRVSSSSQTPVSGAWVLVESLGETDTAWAKVVASTTTAQDGSFKTAGLAPGDYQVRITLGGFAPLVTSPFRLAEGETKDLGALKLASGVAVSGTVTDDTGKPVEDATISMTDSAGRPVFLFSMSTTGSDGGYRVAEVQPGSYVLKVEARGYAPGEKAITLADAALVQDLTLSRGGEIRVLVQDAAGQPVRGARATILDAAGRAVTKTLSLVNLTDGNLGLTNDQGLALLPDLAPGTYRVRIAKEGLVTDGGDVSATVRPGGSADVRVTLRPPS